MSVGARFSAWKLLFSSSALPCQMPFGQTALLLQPVVQQQNVMKYWWEGSTSTDISLKSASDGQQNKIGGITFGEVLIHSLSSSSGRKRPKRLTSILGKNNCEKRLEDHCSDRPNGWQWWLQNLHLQKSEESPYVFILKWFFLYIFALPIKWCRYSLPLCEWILFKLLPVIHWHS